MPWNLMRRDGEVLVVRERDKKVVGRHRDRKKALRQLRALYSIEKASFGGDRSAAGRYAAEQRWKGHVKQESLQLGQRPSWMPVKVYERLKKISEATEKARSLGVTTSVRLATEMTAEEIADLRNEIKEMRGENQAETAQKVISEIGKEGYKRWSEALRLSSLALGMLEEQPKLDPDNYVTEGMSSEQRFATYMNQPPRFSQTEYLVVSRDANGKLAGLAFVGVEDKEQKTASYPIKWFGDTGRTLHIHQFASFQNVPDMGSALFGEVLKAAQGKGVWRVRLEATALSKNYWEKQGFKADYKDALGMEYLIGVDEAASSNMLKASFGGDRSAAGRYAAEQRWKGHVKEDEKGGRSTDAKLAEGPSNLLYGRDEFGMPKMGSLPELKKRYGSSAEKRSQYFRLVYGLRVTVEPVRAGSPEEATQLGGLQALEELCMSINDVPKLVRKVTLEPQVERYDGRAAGVHGQYSSGYVDLATRETAKFATETIKNIAAIQRIMLERGLVSDIFASAEAEAATSGVLASRRYNVSDIFASAEAARTKPSPSPETSPTDIKKASQRAGYAVMIHEFGHAIDFGRNGELSDLGGGQTRDTALSTQQADRLAELPSPSRYGTVNQYEKVAESWASWWLFGGASEGNSPAWATRLRGQGVQILGPILEERKDVVKSEELSLRLLDLPVTHPVTMFIVAPFISSAALIKASFGGDRSAAGRYAAEQRWKGHVKEEPRALTVDNIPKDVLVYRTTGLDPTEQQMRLARKLADSMTIDELRSARMLVWGTEPSPFIKEDAYLIAQGLVVGLGRAWQYQGGDSTSAPVRAAVLHRSVMRVFGEGISGKEETGAGVEYGDWAKQREDENPAGVRAVDAIVKAMYDETQAMFADAKAAGYTHIVMYRGTAMERELTGGYEEISVPLRSMTSWSVSLGAAEKFRGEMRLRGLKDGTPVMLTAKIPIERVFLAQSLVGGRFIEDEMVVFGPSIDATVEETIPALGGYDFQKSLAELLKASFGGDRSAAGRYAAEQRWKGHVKKEPAGGPPSGGAGDFMRLINGTPQTYTVKGVIKVHGFGIEGGISRGHYDDLVKADPNEEGNSNGVLQTTAGEFRRMATSGQLDLSPKWVDHVVRSLEEHSDDTRVAVELGVDAIIVRNQPIVPIRPDQPHTAKDIVSIGQSINHSAQLDEDWGLKNETDKKLTVNTSPRNRGPVKSGTLSRWEKGWETDYYNMPYCKEIASHAAYLMGQIDAPVERWGRRQGFRAPSEAMLAQDAKDLLASINQGVEGQPVLWRGLEPSRSATKGLVDKAKAGDTLTLGLASTSRDALAAAKYTQAYSGESKPIIMRIEEGSKGVSLGDRALYRHDQEVITSGKFEVVDVQTVTVPKWQFPRLGVETIQPSERIAIAQQALPKVKALLPPQQYAAIERSVEREAQKRLEYEKETVTVKIVSVRQTETFNPETEEFEANG